VGHSCTWTILGLLALDILLRNRYISPSRRTIDSTIGPDYESLANIVYASEGLARILTASSELFLLVAAMSCWSTRLELC